MTARSADDWAEIEIRADAMALPPSDYGSARAIQSAARVVSAAYHRGVSDGRNAGSPRQAEIDALIRAGKKLAGVLLRPQRDADEFNAAADAWFAALKPFPEPETKP